MKLANKLAVVTGASKGLGLAIVHRFVQEGASVPLCARTAGDLEGPRKGPDLPKLL
jgi:NAD(P)-dependent dehydrogenase (short-subunit alcohol dehydrogenase family)